MNKIYNKGSAHPASSRRICVALLEQTIKQLSSDSSVRLAQSEDNEGGSKCVILRPAH